MSKRGRAAQVGTYLGPRAFYAKDMAKKDRAGQASTDLPPRCEHCRQSFHVVMINGVPHCPDHSLNCSCGNEVEESDDGD